MLIYKALLTHGFDNFTLEILEYCNPSDLINREQHYIDLLKPEYNILKIAGSRLGAKHSDEVKGKIKAGALGRSEEALTKNREHIKKLNASQKHKDHLAKLNASLEHIAITGKSVIVINTDNGESMEFRSMTQAEKFFKVHPETVCKHIKANKLLLNKYKIMQKN
jgi:group I intron endonuclease